jgi:hypothetical protein
MKKNITKKELEQLHKKTLADLEAIRADRDELRQANDDLLEMIGNLQADLEGAKDGIADLQDAIKHPPRVIIAGPADSAYTEGLQACMAEICADTQGHAPQGHAEKFLAPVPVRGSLPAPVAEPGPDRSPESDLKATRPAPSGPLPEIRMEHLRKIGWQPGHS